MGVFEYTQNIELFFFTMFSKDTIILLSTLITFKRNNFADPIAMEENSTHNYNHLLSC